MKKLDMSQVAGMNLHYLQYTLEYFLNSMVKFGVPNIELWGGYPHLYSEDLTLLEVARIRKDIERRDLNLVCYTPEQLMYANNIAAKETDIRNRSIDYYLKNIEITAELGTNLMLMTSGWGYYHETKDGAWNNAQESLATLSSKAADMGITLLLEPLQPFESNLITDVKTLKKMIEEVNMTSLKGMLDIVAMAVAGESVHEYFQALGDQLLHIHLIDGTPSGHLACGDGTLPIEQYLTDISEYGYNRYLSLELAASSYYTDPDKAFERALKNLNGILSR
jgi:fructoselysine 3-epimerase